MDNERTVQELAAAVSRLLEPHLRQSEPLRQAVGLLGQWLMERARQAGETPAASPRSSSVPDGVDAAQNGHPGGGVSVDPVAKSTPTATQRDNASPVSAVVELRLGDAVVPVAVSGTAAEVERAAKSVRTEPLVESGPDRAAAEAVRSPEETVDLGLVIRRCELQAAACEWAARGLEEGPDEQWQAQRESLIAQAKQEPNCFLWAFWRQDYPLRADHLRQVAGCYWAHAEAVALASDLERSGVTDPETLREPWSLLAEANSALGFAMAGAGMRRPEINQDQMHLWLRTRTQAARVYVPRYMSRSDPADPARAGEVRRQIAAVREAHRVAGTQTRGVDQLLKRIAHHAGRLQREGPEAVRGHIDRIAESVTKLNAAGLPMSDPRIVASIGDQVVEMLGEQSLADGPLAQVLEFHRQRQAAAERPEEPVERRGWSEAVQTARGLLEGGAVVVIGGERRQEAVDRLTEAFGLERVDWVELVEHGPGEPMRAPIARSDVRLVLVITKLTGHVHADEARAYAEAAGKPWVMLEAGYNPERVAYDVLQQAGERLGQRTAV